MQFSLKPDAEPIQEKDNYNIIIDGSYRVISGLIQHLVSGLFDVSSLVVMITPC
jgi:hypothetical protein